MIVLAAAGELKMTLRLAAFTVAVPELGPMRLAVVSPANASPGEFWITVIELGKLACPGLTALTGWLTMAIVICPLVLGELADTSVLI